MTIKERIEEIQRTLDTEQELKPIRLEKTRKRRPGDLSDFLYKFFTDYNEERCTINAKTREEHCDVGRRRSLNDIYRICRYYYDCTLPEVVRVLHKELLKMGGFVSSYCHCINKRVYYYDPNRQNEIYDRQRGDQYGLTWEQWNRNI